VKPALLCRSIRRLVRVAALGTLLACQRDPAPAPPRVAVIPALPARPDAPAAALVVEPASPRPSVDVAAARPAAEAAALTSIEQRYLGTHALGVNRVSYQRRCGTVQVTKQNGVLQLVGKAEEGAYNIAISGTIEHQSAEQFTLTGELSGIPNMAWADEAPRQRHTRGRFTFRATKGRKFWRLYQVDGVECVCNESCGNDFCYIDIDIATTHQPAGASSRR